MLANRDITVHQLTNNQFYQVPQLFFRRLERKWDSERQMLIKICHTSPYVRLSSDAKLAYGALFNRCQLSIHTYEQGNTDYVDENGSVFMIYTVQDLMELLDKSKPTVTKIKKELVALGLLREVRQGNNKPNRLYLQNVDATCQVVEHYDDSGNLMKRFDYFGKLLYKSVAESKNMAKTLATSGSKKIERPNNLPPEGKNFNPSNTNKSNTEYKDISSRKAEKISDEISQPTETDSSTTQEKSEKFIPPQYYSLLNVIADRYNGKFAQFDLFTGQSQNYTLTHRQKMLIGQYLAEEYVTSQEVLDMIERMPIDCEKPLAYLMKMLENLKEERRLEAKIVAHRMAEQGFKKGVG